VPEGLSRNCTADNGAPICEVEIGRKVRFLSRPDSYPEQPSRIEAIETHYSWVFLTDTHAYKLKKPVQGDGFDFCSVAARRRNALAELRLNRRLAPGVYLRVVKLTLAADGTLALGGPGAPADWLVQMVRLEADWMFDRRLARRDWHYAEIQGLAHRLAGFFATARRVRLSAPQFKTRITQELRATLTAFQAGSENRLLTELKPITRRLDAFMTRRAPLFRQRIHDRDWSTGMATCGLSIFTSEICRGSSIAWSSAPIYGSSTPSMRLPISRWNAAGSAGQPSRGISCRGTGRAPATPRRANWFASTRRSMR
jgi:hypothetical protein